MNDLLTVLRDAFGSDPFTAEQVLARPGIAAHLPANVGYALARVARGEPGVSAVKSLGSSLRHLAELERAGKTREGATLWRIPFAG